MKTLVILVICPLYLAALAHFSRGMPYEEDNCLRTVTEMIIEDCSKGKRSIMLQELGSALSRHRAAKYGHNGAVKNEGNIGELLGVPSGWVDDDLQEVRRQYRENIQHLWVECCFNKSSCPKDVFRGSCK